MGPLVLVAPPFPSPPQVRAKVSAAVASQRLAAKQGQRTQKKDKDEGPQGSGGGNSTVVTLRRWGWEG